MKGKHFVLEESNSLFVPQSAYKYGLKPHMFYKQSAMFTEFLFTKNKADFKELLILIQKEGGFKNSFYKAFDMPLEEEWRMFVNHLKNTSK